MPSTFLLTEHVLRLNGHKASSSRDKKEKDLQASATTTISHHSITASKAFPDMPWVAQSSASGCGSRLGTASDACALEPVPADAPSGRFGSQVHKASRSPHVFNTTGTTSLSPELKPQDFPKPLSVSPNGTASGDASTLGRFLGWLSLAGL